MERQCMNRTPTSFKEETDELLEGTNETSGVFLVNPSCTQLGEDKFRILKPGDHITCHRSYIIYHHAIVVDVDTSGNRLHVIHYSTVERKRIKDKKCQIIKEWLNRDQLLGDWYRIDYPKQVTDNNGTEKVLERAHSRLGEKDYRMLKNNCESFASFCKTGVSHCLQTKWVKGKVKEIIWVNTKRVLNDIPKLGCTLAKNIKGGALAKKITSDIAEGAIKQSTNKIAIAEGLEKVCKASNYVGAGLVVGAEAGFMAYDIRKMSSKREDGGISRNVFTEMATQRATEAAGATVGTIGLGLGLEAFGAFIGGGIGSAVPVIGTVIGAAVGAFIGSFVGGIIGSVVGRAGGSLLGPQIAKIIKKCIQDDKAVNSIDDINPGDHIIVYASFFHRHCHAIVVNVRKPKTILLIRNKFRRGVVDDTMEFKKPVYKVLYSEGTAYSPEVVVSRAQSKVGQNEYSFFMNDCKAFARWCVQRSK